MFPNLCVCNLLFLLEYLVVVSIELHLIISGMLLICQDYFECYCCPPRHLHAFLSLVSYVYILCFSIHDIHTEYQHGIFRFLKQTSQESKQNSKRKKYGKWSKCISRQKNTSRKESKQAYIWIVLHENVCLDCSIIKQDDPY